jgi:hypothetical protein
VGEVEGHQVDQVEGHQADPAAAQARVGREAVEVLVVRVVGPEIAKYLKLFL